MRSLPIELIVDGHIVTDGDPSDVMWNDHLKMRVDGLQPATPSLFRLFRVDTECVSLEPTTTPTAVPSMDPMPQSTDRPPVQSTREPLNHPASALTDEPSSYPTSVSIVSDGRSERVTSQIQTRPAPTDPLELLSGGVLQNIRAPMAMVYMY